MRSAVMQALGESDRIGLVASSAAMAQSSTGSIQAPAAALQANAGGAEIARTIAPQIASAISAGPGSGRIELRLDPPELGRVEISLEITDQSLRATLAVERPATNELLRRHIDVLLAQLQQAGFTEIDLEFTENHAGGRAADQGGAQPGDAPRTGLAGDPGARTNDDTTNPSASRVARQATDGLDLRL